MAGRGHPRIFKTGEEFLDEETEALRIAIKALENI